VLKTWWAALRRWATDRWGQWRAKPLKWQAPRVATVVVVIAGGYGVQQATNLGLALILLLVALLPAWRRFDEVAGRLAGALLIATVALVGVNVFIGIFGRLPIEPGLVGAIGVVFAVALWYLWGAGWGKRWTFPAAAVLALVGVLVPPIVAAELAKDDSQPVNAPTPVRSRLDVLIVTDGSTHPEPAAVAPDPTLARFDVRYAVGVADDGNVRWTLRDGTNVEALKAIARGSDGQDARPPQRRDKVDSVLLLVVDGTPPVVDAPEDLEPATASDGEIERWRSVTRSVRDAIDGDRLPTPAFALLQTTNAERLADWESFTGSSAVASLQGLQTHTLTDAALLAIQAPSAKADLALAIKHRPALLFDDGESVPRPLSIEAMFTEGRVFLCDEKPKTGSGCPDEPTTDSSQLESGDRHLRLVRPSSRELVATAKAERNRSRDETRARQTELPAAAAPPEGTPQPGATQAPLGDGSAIYVHPLHRGKLVYLDYWWYLADNPARAGAGSMCGAGLVIAGATCHDHESDWEGVTVVVDPSGKAPVVTEVHYAQHNRVMSYPWNDLRAYWATEDLHEFTRWVDDASNRPLVFVAQGTHASYPSPCDADDDCKQVGGHGLLKLGENRHDGKLEWGANNVLLCGAESCLKALPTAAGGDQPALWDDFTGPWGDTHCIWRYYCDSGPPPGAPGHQGRYEDPSKATRHTGRVDR
jgi:hypothetical protein